MRNLNRAGLAILVVLIAASYEKIAVRADAQARFTTVT